MLDEDEDIQSWRERLDVHRKNIRENRFKESFFGRENTPNHVLLDTENRQKELKRIKQYLRCHNIPVQDGPDDGDETDTAADLSQAIDTLISAELLARPIGQLDSGNHRPGLTQGDSPAGECRATHLRIDISDTKGTESKPYAVRFQYGTITYGDVPEWSVEPSEGMDDITSDLDKEFFSYIKGISEKFEKAAVIEIVIERDKILNLSKKRWYKWLVKEQNVVVRWKVERSPDEVKLAAQNWCKAWNQVLYGRTFKIIKRDNLHEINGKFHRGIVILLFNPGKGNFLKDLHRNGTFVALWTYGDDESKHKSLEDFINERTSREICHLWQLPETIKALRYSAAKDKSEQPEELCLLWDPPGNLDATRQYQPLSAPHREHQ